jgi:hypothetical protein
MAARLNKFGEIVGGKAGSSPTPPTGSRSGDPEWNAKLGSMKHGKLGEKVSPKAVPAARKRKTSTAQQPRTQPVPAPSGSSGCFVATAACGPESPEVLWLRLYRDDILLQSMVGSLFVRLYYLLSPPVAAVITAIPTLRRLVRYSVVAPLAAYARRQIGEPRPRPKTG